MAKSKKEPDRPGLRPRFLALLGLYLDDLLMVAAGVCFTTSAGMAFGCPAALAVAGACLLAYGIVVARSKGGGDRP